MNMDKVIHIQKADSEVDEDINIHYMPCKIHSDGEAKVSQYFSPNITKDDKNGLLKASFRGYPLIGKAITLPKGYKGLVLQENNQSNIDKERKLFTKHVFKELVYWNWDKTPSKNDAFISALDWIDIAEAIHAPIGDENIAST
uniref:Uncharacterized protein n=1 Tax=Clastoptera arizonana TaxID=38151 RepID=A0A1B6CQE6_9HEMI